MATRNCWVILERKAHDQVREVQQDMGTVQSKIEQLQTTLDKLTGMYAEYQSSEQSAGKRMGLQSSLNQRQFMSQLLALRERIERDMSHQQGLLAQLRTRLIKAEAERMKMQSLVDQQEQTDRQLQQMVEQKRLDEMGVSRFNARHSH